MGRFLKYFLRRKNIFARYLRITVDLFDEKHRFETKITHLRAYCVVISKQKQKTNTNCIICRGAKMMKFCYRTAYLHIYLFII